MKFLSCLGSLFLCVVFLAQSAGATIVPSIPYNLTNGSLADATQVMGNFNTIITDVNANGAHNGVNSDITSITGLTTPLSNAQGGTAVYNGGVSTGTANAQVFGTTAPLNYSLTTGNIVTGVASVSNSGALTINVAGTGVKAVDKTVAGGLTAVVSGDVIANGGYVFYWDGTEYIILNPTLPAIAAGSITNAQLASMANNTVKGNVSGGSASPSDLTTTQLTTLINAVTSSLSGAAPASGGGTANFLRADGTWTVPPGTGLTSLVFTPFGVGSISSAKHTGSVSAGGTVAGSTLTITDTADNPTGDPAPSGTWQALYSVGSGAVGLWQRTN